MSDHTTVLPEYQPQPEPRRPWGIIAVVASVLAVVLIAAGGFAAWRFFAGGGPRPAEVLPASTFALVTVDLDPSGGQKVEAIKTLRKFPSFRDESGLEAGLRPAQAALRRGPEAGPVRGPRLRARHQVLGRRSASGSAACCSTGKPVPVATRPGQRPRQGEEWLRAAGRQCAELDEDDDFGWTLTDDYIVASDSTAARQGRSRPQGKKSPLSENEDFQKWTDEAGGAGIVNAYVGPKAVDVASEELSSAPVASGSCDDALPGSPEDEDELADALAAYKDFQGAAAVLRFADGGIELSFAGGGGKADRGQGDRRRPRRRRCRGTPPCCSPSRSRPARSTPSRRPTRTARARTSSAAMLGHRLPGGPRDPARQVPEHQPRWRRSGRPRLDRGARRPLGRRPHPRRRATRSRT